MLVWDGIITGINLALLLLYICLIVLMIRALLKYLRSKNELTFLLMIC